MRGAILGVAILVTLPTISARAHGEITPRPLPVRPAYPPLRLATPQKFVEGVVNSIVVRAARLKATGQAKPCDRLWSMATLKSDGCDPFRQSTEETNLPALADPSLVDTIIIERPLDPKN